jgi:geranylgeranyl diphosphate synthase type II
MASGSTTAVFADFAPQLQSAIGTALENYCRFPEECPAKLAEAIRYALLAPGKRMRPILTLLAAEACGASHEAAMPAACAVEMVHTYSLVHDDLPAMDDDDLRRGQATCHKKFGEGLAILAGDALLTLAFETVAQNIRPAEVAAVCCVELAGAAGARGMVGGQADDLSAGQTAGGALGVLESIHRRKTGAMFRAAMRMGGVVGGASPAALESLDEFGACLGLSFQIVDDLLDVSGDSAEVGKRVQKDADRGKLTFPALLGVDESRRQAEQFIEQAVGALENVATRPSVGVDRLESIARYVLERNR